ncbi:MAG: hypothetical protein IJ783_07450 [Kiritimatiellae bacterium]|nr:hypothetical protein [Kiritimatiellia bacterium]
MYSVLISLAVSATAAFVLLRTGTASPVWSAVWSVLVFVAVMAGIGAIVRKRVAKVMAALQDGIVEGQKSLQARIDAWQKRPRGDVRAFQEEIRKRQEGFIHEALAKTSELDRFRGWVPFFARQANTTRMQFWYQLRRFDKVDELLPRCLILDPFAAAMKLARQYETGAGVPEMEKTYRKARARLRYNQSALLSSVMAWIYLHKNRPDAAYETVEKACKDNNVEEEPNAALARNRDALANNRVRQFSNASFGDAWYALFLEEPRMRIERRPPPGRFGKFG